MEDYTRYELINYFDVWGNAKDGWEINNLCVEFDDLYLLNGLTDKEILNSLVTAGFLTTSDMRRFNVYWSGEMIEIFEKRGNKPLCALREVVAN